MLEFVFGSKKLVKSNVKVFFAGKADFKRIEKELNEEEKKLLKVVAAQSDFKGKSGDIVEFITTSGKILVLGIGEKPNDLSFQKAGKSIYKILSKDKEAVVFADNADAAYNIAFGADLGSYSFDKYFTSKKKEDYPSLEKLTFLAPGKLDKKGYSDFAAMARGVQYAKDLVNEPANYLNPETYAKDLKRMEMLGLKVDVLDKKEMAKLGMGLLLGVAQGSNNEPKVVILKWQGAKSKKDFDTAFVGKGVTFDSGGINIKPSSGMEAMKGDMAGSAAVVATMKAIALQKLPINIIGAVGLVENMPSGTAIRPSDILKSMSGQTVEIGNTDAEGRLVLADVMWYVQDKLKVKKLIDIATLTGATSNALGGKYASVLGNDDKLIKKLIGAGIEVDEKLWQMPLTDEHDKMIKSNIADMNNIASGGAGMSTAAAFLQRFVKKGVAWAHIDMAGCGLANEVKAGSSKGATGFGVRLLRGFARHL